MEKLNFDINQFGDWYHDFSSLQIDNLQRGAIYPENQICKEGIILSYLRLAIEKLKTKKDHISILELFAADCYYSFHAIKYGATDIDCVEHNQIPLNQANLLIEHWGLHDKIKTVKSDVFDYKSDHKYDIVMCCGGLYHISNPDILIKKITSEFNPKYLIIQTVVPMNKVFEKDEYFVSPAPGWDWGSRFNKKYLDRIFFENNLHTVDFTVNELKANEDISNRGSIYYLLQTK